MSTPKAPARERRFVSELRTFEPELDGENGANPAGDDDDDDDDEEDEYRDLGGYAAKYNVPTTIGGYFQERIAPGAFANAVVNDDVRALFNHDPNFVIGRTASKTLSLAEDDTGLTWRATPPPTTWAKDLAASIDRGDISGCSFQFLCNVEEWDFSGDMPMRTLIDCSLIDVSAVTFPAYEDTNVALRTLETGRRSAGLLIGGALPTEADLARLSRKRANLDRLVRG